MRERTSVPRYIGDVERAAVGKGCEWRAALGGFRMEVDEGANSSFQVSFWGWGPSCHVVHSAPTKTFLFFNFIGLLVKEQILVLSNIELI